MTEGPTARNTPAPPPTCPGREYACYELGKIHPALKMLETFQALIASPEI